MKEPRFPLRILTVCLLTTIYAFTDLRAQVVTEQWVARFNGAANDADQATALAIDEAGNIYVTGNSWGGATTNDYLTIKYHPDGTEAWVTRVNFVTGNTMGNDFAEDIAVDNAGHVYVTGQGSNAYATVKYNSTTGDTIWARKFRSGPNTTDHARRIALDDLGNIYVTGTLNSMTANPQVEDIGTIKYNSEGDTLWVRRFDGANDRDTPKDLWVDKAGNVYITGQSDSSGSNIITIKYNTDGVELWSRRYGDRPTDEAKAIAVDDEGNVYVTGRSGRDYLTLKYDASGVLQWVRLFDFDSADDRAFAITTDGVHVYVSGQSGASYGTVKYAPNGDVAWADTISAAEGNRRPGVSAMAVDNFNNVYVTGHRATAASESDYLTVKYSSDGVRQWSAEYNGPGNGVDTAVDIGVDHLGNVYVTGASEGDTTDNDYATICYGQRGGGRPIDCWTSDPFDNLSLGSLNGQNGWFTVPGRSAAFVVANPFGPGQVLRMDAGPNQTVIMGKDVNDQFSGVHSIKLNVLVDGDPDPAEPTLAKVEIRTTGNPNWDKKFQLYFGAHMRLNFGPTLPEAQVFLPENELVLRRWYEVEAVVDLESNLVDVFLDGQLRLNDIAVGPGPITDISISAWDRRGVVYYNNLNFCRSGAPPAPDPCTAASSFDFDDEDWRVVDSQGALFTPDHVPTGGNPDGYISANDDAIGGVWFWQAPAQFLGDASCAYGQALNFDLQQSDTTTQFDWEDVVLEGGGLTLVFDTPCNPGLCSPGVNWTSYSVPLLETAGWKKDDAIDGVISDEAPTREEMQAVLASLTRVWIRGDFANGSAVDGLDNVVLNGPPKGVGPLRCVAQNIVSEEGDGDGRAEAGERIGVAIELANDGVDKATTVQGTLSTSDADIAIQNDQTTWPDIAAGDTAESLGSFEFDISPTLSAEKVVTFTLTVEATNGGPWGCTFDLVIAPENQPPLVSSPIADTTVAVGDSVLVRDLNANPAVFRDPDQDASALTYSAISSAPDKVTAALSGSRLSVVAADTGLATITVTADDGRGGQAQTQFTITVELITSVESATETGVVTDFRLYQNYPNPFNPSTTIRFDIAVASEVRLTVYDLLGREVKRLVDERFEAGRYSVSWDGRNSDGQVVSSGIYFIHMRAGDFVRVNKTALVR